MREKAGWGEDMEEAGWAVHDRMQINKYELIYFITASYKQA